jgi:hypothetical protein
MKDTLEEIDTKKRLIQISQNLFIMRTILSDQNEIDENANEVHTWNHLSINNEVITRMICFIIVFYFTLIHCFTIEKLKNVFNSVNDETLLNRVSSLSSSNKFLNLIEKFFRFRLTNKWVFNKKFIQINKCIIIFFINWWRMFIIMIWCIIIKLCFQTKFFISWIQSFFRFAISFFRWWRICFLINSWMRYDYFFFKFSRSSKDIW